ncbi:MAG: NTP transferase domain-containing protein [Lachnospiraceae bacterium]|nr:NTP transferase domain-containing protein [Lachnospiraceae bacterium]
MNIIIPMTGYGSRFVAAGYKELKPFIPVMGKPIVEWIVTKMYPADVNFIFVCRGEHLEKDPSMREKLLALAPQATVVSIEEWVKKGPVYDVLRAYRGLKDTDAIDVTQPCIINYCDFYMEWDFEEFAKKAKERNCDGAVPCYTGFHPNLLPEKNYYASCLTDEEDNLVEIREKYSFEKDKTKAKHSPGVYYFKNGDIMEKYCQMLTEHEECAINGEFYASLPYNFMVKDGLKVWVPTNVSYFCQWGTPEDMQEFVYWTDMVRRAEQKKASNAEAVGNQKGSSRILIPMAGAGQRFADAGYQVHKPAIMTIDRETGEEKPMVVCATKDLPGVASDGSNVIYVDRTFHKTDGVEDTIHKYYPKATFITVDHLTEGQACTCMLAEEMLDPEEPLLIAGCDNGMDIDTEAFETLTKDCDCIVFTYRHNEAVLANPNAYGWMITDEEGNITGTSIKRAISDTPMEDPAVVATFWFRKAKVFLEATKKMIAENDRINGEFYVDQTAKHVLDLGYKAKIFDIERYVGWGTPADYEAYQKTWQYFKEFVTLQQ